MFADPGPRASDRAAGRMRRLRMQGVIARRVVVGRRVAVLLVVMVGAAVARRVMLVEGRRRRRRVLVVVRRERRRLRMMLLHVATEEARTGLADAAAHSLVAVAATVVQLDVRHGAVVARRLATAAGDDTGRRTDYSRID